jgi:DNA-binding NarL/FixJ family response regulator
VAVRIQVALYAADPIVHAGLSSMVRARPELELVGEAAAEQVAAVQLMCLDAVDEEALTLIRKQVRKLAGPVVLIVGAMREAELMSVIECGVATVVWRREATIDRLVRAVQASRRGDGTLPADLLGRLLAQLSRMQRPGGPAPGLSGSRLSDRETDIVRLIAEGLETIEIAAKLCYSERTVKNVLHGLMTRMQLRNRAHAVAYAAREGYLR